MGVQGFPTLKIVKPGKKFGKPIVEDYQGAREAKPIIEAVSAKIANHVSKITDKELDAFMAENVDTHKAILFTEKGSTSSLLKAIAIDFLGGIKVAQIRSKEARAVEMFSVEKFPTIVLLPAGNGASATTYDGELKKDDIVKFLSSVHPPNPDPAPAKAKAPKEKKAEKKSEKKADKKAAKKAEEEFEEASSSQKESEASAEASKEASEPTESPTPGAEKPVVLTPPIPVITSEAELADACLTPKSGTCVLAFTSAKGGDVSVQSIESLAEVAFKYQNSKHAIFPFYAVAEEVTGMPELKAGLGLTNDVDVVAINAKRGWMRKYSGDVYTHEAIEMWIDSIRMGEGEKQVLPGILIGKTPEQVAQTTTIQVEETEPKETVSVKDEL
jgi:protein disulfide-isomerase A6